MEVRKLTTKQISQPSGPVSVFRSPHKEVNNGNIFFNQKMFLTQIFSIFFLINVLILLVKFITLIIEKNI